MKMLSSDAFLKDFGDVAKQTMDLSIYNGSWQCACGKTHWFDRGRVLGQGWPMKLLVTCPDDPHYVTSLKIKTFLMFKFKGFESLSGTQLSDEELNNLVMLCRALERM